MFTFLFKYPASAFSHGQVVLLGPWPNWILPVAILIAAAGLAWLMRAKLLRLPGGPLVSGSSRWRAGAIWILQTALAVVVLLLIWQPALLTTELKAQQDVIAFVIDDSRSMA